MKSLNEIKRILVVDPSKADEVLTRRNVICTVLLFIGFVIYTFVGNDGNAVVYRALAPYGYKNKMAKGWIPFYEYVDRNDIQYKAFIKNTYALTKFMAVHILLPKVVGKITRDTMMEKIMSVILSSGLMWIMYGSGAINLHIVIMMNYAMIRATRRWRRISIAATWVVWLGLLCTGEEMRGYELRDIHKNLRVLDTWKGVGNRWYMILNFMSLKAISYNIDFINALHRRQNDGKKKCSCMSEDKHKSGGGNWDKYKDSCRSVRCMGYALDRYYDYTLFNYFSYMTYCPLLICGPIITYNDFTHQTKKKYSPSPGLFPYREFSIYVLNSIVYFIIYELFLHICHINAIFDTKGWLFLYPRHIFVIIGATFLDAPLKLLIIWRFFRTWAFLDRIYTIENFGYPIFCIYSIRKVWREWHRSFNKWSLQYIYFPLGGNSRSDLNTALVFFFVGIWHNSQKHILLFSVANTLVISQLSILTCILPKILSIIPSTKRFFTPVAHSKNPILEFLFWFLSDIPLLLVNFIVCITGIAVYFTGVSDMIQIFRVYLSQNHYIGTVTHILWLVLWLKFSRLAPKLSMFNKYHTSEY